MLASDYGLIADPWQADVLDVWLARNKYDEWVALLCGLMVPRQNGKNGGAEIRELFGMVILGEQVLHTSHHQKTSTKAFKSLRDCFKHPDLKKLLESEPYSALGREAIYLKNGGNIEYIARSRSSGRGFTKDLLILDEAQELTDEQLEALESTTSAAPLGNPQTIIFGTPPNHNMPADLLRRTRAAALEGKDKSLSWHEWSVEEIGDIRDTSRWEDTNPALGKRIKPSSIEKELRVLSEDGFARERLGYWTKTVVNALVSKDDWDHLKTSKPPLEGRKAFGVKFSPDGAWVSLAVALRPKKGPIHIEVLEHRSTSNGTQWLVDWIVDVWKAATIIVIDGKSGAPALLDKLAIEKVPKRVAREPQVKEVTAAAPMLLNAIREETVTHFDQPLLTESMLNAQRRKIGTGGGWGFGGTPEIDISPVEACALAHWGVITSKRDPDRKMRVG